jgi:hypothetical protein
MDIVKATAALVAAGLLAGCADPSYRTTDADPVAETQDSLEDEMMAPDPANPGTIPDTPGTTIP